MNGVMVATYRVKGGELDTRIVRDPTIRAAMIDYLEASGRLEGMTEETPIWTRHDRAGKPGGPGRSWSFPCIASLPLAQQASSSLILGPDNPGRSPACKAIGRLASG